MTSSLQLQGYAVAITGAGSGIGRALALAYAARGARVLASDVSAERLAALAAECPALAAETHVMDVAVRADWDAWAARIERDAGRLDVLINNAGVALAADLKTMTDADAQWLMGINFWGVFHGCRAMRPLLLQAAIRGARTPMVVNVSSLFAFVSQPTQVLYNASKAAVRALSDGLREELRDESGKQLVQVLCVHPGGVKTRISADARTGDFSRLAASRAELNATFDWAARTSPERAAQTILRAQLKGKTRVLIGADAHLTDWLARIDPANASRRFMTVLDFARRFAPRA